MAENTSLVSINGDVAMPLALSASDLAALPSTSVTITVAGQAQSYAGVSIYSLLQQAQFEYPAVKNGQLHDTIQVTDADGDQVVLSEGELDPAFGGASSTAILATSENGLAIAPTLIVPGDANGGIGGRDLVNVTALTVGEATVPAVPPATVPPATFTLSGAVTHPGTYTVAEVEALQSTTQTDTFLAGPTPETFTFTGTTLFNLISTAGLSPAAQANLLDDYVLVTGSDGYAVVYSLGELAYHQGPVALLAYDDGTGTFPSIGGGEGDFRTTAPFDSKGGRYDSNIESIEVETVACFRAGTRITTRIGVLPVEQLQVGMRVITPGGSRPITWIGQRRLDPARHPRPAQILPVRIAAAAFGPHLPERDLYLSPDHAIFWDGVLIPVRHLLNGSSVAQTCHLQPLTYWHVELDRHDVLLAEGLATESYLATGPARFAESNPIVTLHPGASSQIWDAQSYAPLTVTGPEVERLKAWLASQPQADLQAQL